MALLDSFRRNKDSWSFVFLILLIVFVMAMFGVGKLDSSNSEGGAAAWVNGEVITTGEFRAQLRSRVMQYRQILGDQYDEKLLLTLRLPQQVLEQLVNFKLLSQQAKQMGFLVPDVELATFIQEAPEFQINGKFDAERYQQIPEKGTMERSQREYMTMSKMQQYLQGRLRLTPAELKRDFALDEVKVELQYAKVDFKNLASKHTPSATEIEAVAKNAPEGELREYYESHKIQFTRRGQAKIRQIRAGVPFQASEEKKKQAKEKIEAAAKEIASGKSFASVAKKVSDDEYGKHGGDRGWVLDGTLAAPLADAVARLEPGTVSGPIDTPMGWFLVQVEDKKPQQEIPFDQAKAEVAKAVANVRYAKELETKKKAEWDNSLKAGRNIEADLKSAGVTIEKTEPFALGQGMVPQLGEADAILDAVALLTEKQPVAPALIPHGGQYYYLKLARVVRPTKGAFDKQWEAVNREAEASLQNDLFSAWIASLKKTSTIKQALKFDESSLQL